LYIIIHVNDLFVLASIVAGSDSMLNAKSGNGVGSLSMSLIFVLSVRVLVPTS